MSDLVKRLREGRTDGTALTWTVTPIHREAADEIERLRGERNFYLNSAETGAKMELLLAERCEAAQAEIARHREALEKIAGITMSMCLSVGDLAQRQKDIALEALGDPMNDIVTDAPETGPPPRDASDPANRLYTWEHVAAARREGIEAAAKEVDCGCAIRDAVLERLEAQGQKQASYLCQHGNACCALQAAEIRTLKWEALRDDHNSVKRWKACGHSQCSMIDAFTIRALLEDGR